MSYPENIFLIARENYLKNCLQQKRGERERERERYRDREREREREREKYKETSCLARGVRERGCV